jgi:hypothetical protein
MYNKFNRKHVDFLLCNMVGEIRVDLTPPEIREIKE